MMFELACGVIILVAFMANLRDRRMLVLTMVVGVAFFLPVPRATAEQFYTFCIVAEIGVAVSAYFIRAAGSEVVIELCLFLVIAHLMGYSLDGNPPLSPYRVIVKILEFVQVSACLAFSPKIAPLLRSGHAKIR